MTISATPATLVSSLTPASVFVMQDLVNTANVSYRRTIQSVVIYNNANINSQFVIRVGNQTVFKETLQPAQTFTIEGIKFTQLGSNNAETKLSVEAVTANSNFNIVVTYTTITES